LSSFRLKVEKSKKQPLKLILYGGVIMHKYKNKFILTFFFILLGLILGSKVHPKATPLSDWELKSDGYYYFVGSFPHDGFYHLISIPTEHESQELEYFEFETNTWKVVPPINSETGRGSNQVYISFYDMGYLNSLKISTSTSDQDKLTEKTDDFPNRKLRYQSPDTLSPVINGETNYITNIDNPVSESQIRSGLHAFDNVDGHLDSTHFVLVSDNYTANQNTLGTYIIKYSVSDTAGNTSYVNVNVKVVDVIKPTITGTNSYEIVYNQVLDIETIKNNLTVSDNYETGLLPVLVSDTYSVNKDVVGSWKITYEATDSSNNKSDLFTVTVNVIDNIKPVISGQDSYSTGTKVKLLESEIRAAITATDDYDGSLELELIYDDYTENHHLLGNYIIMYRATDSSNNFMNFQVNIHVTDDTPPEIFTNRYFINIDGALNYTLDEIIQHLVDTGQISAETLTNYDISSSNYYQAPGEYEVILTKKASAPSELAENIVIKIKVFEQNELINPIDDQFNDKPRNPVVLIVIGVVIVGLAAVSIMLGITMKRRKKYKNN
jgi:hypothetical protein